MVKRISRRAQSSCDQADASTSSSRILVHTNNLLVYATVGRPLFCGKTFLKKPSSVGQSYLQPVLKSDSLCHQKPTDQDPHSADLFLHICWAAYTARVCEQLPGHHRLTHPKYVSRLCPVAGEMPRVGGLYLLLFSAWGPAPTACNRAAEMLKVLVKSKADCVVWSGSQSSPSCDLKALCILLTLSPLPHFPPPPLPFLTQLQPGHSWPCTPCPFTCSSRPGPAFPPRATQRSPHIRVFVMLFLNRVPWSPFLESQHLTLFLSLLSLLATYPHLPCIPLPLCVSLLTITLSGSTRADLCLSCLWLNLKWPSSFPASRASLVPLWQLAPREKSPSPPRPQPKTTPALPLSAQENRHWPLRAQGTQQVLSTCLLSERGEPPSLLPLLLPQHLQPPPRCRVPSLLASTRPLHPPPPWTLTELSVWPQKLSLWLPELLSARMGPTSTCTFRMHVGAAWLPNTPLAGPP